MLKKDKIGYLTLKMLLVLMLLILYVFYSLLFVEKYFFDQDKLSLSNTTLFERKILEADGYLQLLIEQVNVSI
jgi:hypothetical protein